MINLKSIYKQVMDSIDNLSREELIKSLDEAECIYIDLNDMIEEESSYNSDTFKAYEVSYNYSYNSSNHESVKAA